MRLPRITSLLAAGVATIGLAACGDTTHNREASNSGIYVDLGHLKYQVQISRQLNVFSPEDSAYVQGLAPDVKKLAPGQAWFMVSVLVVNKHGAAYPDATLADYFIKDTQGTTYRPTPIPAVNPFAYQPSTLAGHSKVPITDSPADTGPTQGAVLLFKVPITAYDNRPLILHIVDPGDASQEATVALDV